MFFLCASLLATICKIIYGIKAMKNDFDNLSILKLHSMKEEFAELFMMFITRKKSTRVAYESSLLDKIRVKCVRQKPSARDKEDEKDLILILKKLVRSAVANRKRHENVKMVAI